MILCYHKTTSPDHCEIASRITSFLLMMEDDKRVLRKRAAFFSAEAGHLCYVHEGGDLNSARGWSLKMQVNIVISVLEELISKDTKRSPRPIIGLSSTIKCAGT